MTYDQPSAVRAEGGTGFADNAVHQDSGGLGLWLAVRRPVAQFSGVAGIFPTVRRIRRDLHGRIEGDVKSLPGLGADKNTIIRIGGGGTGSEDAADLVVAEDSAAENDGDEENFPRRTIKKPLQSRHDDTPKVKRDT